MTLLGISDDDNSVCRHIENSRGLFHRAIVMESENQSGNVNDYVSQQLAQRLGFGSSSEVKLLSFLEKVDPEVIVRVWQLILDDAAERKINLVADALDESERTSGCELKVDVPNNVTLVIGGTYLDNFDDDKKFNTRIERLIHHRRCTSAASTYAYRLDAKVKRNLLKDAFTMFCSNDVGESLTSSNSAYDFIQMLINFAKTGNPNLPGVKIAWPASSDFDMLMGLSVEETEQKFIIFSETVSNSHEALKPLRRGGGGSRRGGSGNLSWMWIAIISGLVIGVPLLIIILMFVCRFGNQDS